MPLSTFATLKTTTEPRELKRFQQLNAVRIQGVIPPGVSLDTALTMLETEAGKILPQGFTVDYAGESRQLRTEGSKFLGTFLLSAILIYLVLAAQFESFRDPFIILAGSVPLALSGALLFPFLGATTLNIYSQIGLITLVGLVAKNGILIVEFANKLQEEGRDKLHAVIEAATTRLRPILMTTAATVMGHMPLVFASGPGAGARNSIGITLVSGMIIGIDLHAVLRAGDLRSRGADPQEDRGRGRERREIGAGSGGSGGLSALVESVATRARPARPSREEGLAPALSAIARAVAESLSLKDVFSRVAEAARLALPFDTMGVNVSENPDLPPDARPEDESFSVYSVVGKGALEEMGTTYRRSDVSPQFRLPEIGQVVRYGDVARFLDPAFALDKRAIDLGCRSLIATLLPGPRPLGSMWFASTGPDAYLPEDEDTVRAIADLLALALQHEQLFGKERERRQRSEALEALLPTLSKALDIREVFDQLSTAVAGILPHDRMVLGLLSKDRKNVHIHAYSGERMPDLPRTIPLDDEARESSEWSFFLVPDIRREPGCCTEKFELMKQDGIRSLLRVPDPPGGGHRRRVELPLAERGAVPGRGCRHRAAHRGPGRARSLSREDRGGGAPRGRGPRRGDPAGGPRGVAHRAARLHRRSAPDHRPVAVVA